MINTDGGYWMIGSGSVYKSNELRKEGFCHGLAATTGDMQRDLLEASWLENIDDEWVDSPSATVTGALFFLNNSLLGLVLCFI